MDKEKNLRDLKRFDSIGRGIAIVLSFVVAVVSFYSVYWHMTEGKPPGGFLGVMFMLAVGGMAAWVCIQNLKGKQ